MNKPLVAIVGRPNVGKSTLFNKLVGSRVALVSDIAGVTRDRIFGDAHYGDRVYQVVDTGGIDESLDDAVGSGIREQAQIAIDEARVVLLVTDARTGITQADREVAERLRQASCTVAVVANKVDVDAVSDEAMEMYELGFEQVFPISAEHGRNLEPLCDFIVDTIDPPRDEEDPQMGPQPVMDDEPAEEEQEASTEPTRIEWLGGPVLVAVIGRPNAGKSSLINRLLGEERLLATPVAGTTRDAVDTQLQVDGQDFVLVDTAGVRRKRAVSEALEKFAVIKAFRSIESADVVVLLVDAEHGASEQDAKLASIADEKGKGLLVLANKWDLMNEDEVRTSFDDELARRLRFLNYVPTMKVSAKTGRGVEKILPAVLKIQRERHRRVRTGELNRFFDYVAEYHPPPVRGGKRSRLYFASQPLVRPPTFVFTASRVSNIPDSYTRYLKNALRERYGFEGTPLWIKYRSHGR